MKLHTLQSFLRSLIEPLALSSAGSVADDLRRACDLLGSMGEMNLAQFSSTLEQMKSYEQTKEIAVPPSLRAFVSCFEAIRSLKNRAALPEANREEIARELAMVPLDSFEKGELVRLCTDLGVPVNAKATKPQAIESIWQSLTGANKPKAAKKPATPRTPKPKSTFPVEEYAQKVSALKDRAISPDSTREELEQSLAELKLNDVGAKDVVALAKQLSCPVNAKTKKDEAIRCIEDVVLGTKELVGGVR